MTYILFKCGNDGQWTPSTVSCDTVTNPATTTTTTTTPEPTTTASSCTWTRIYKNFQTVTLIGKYKNVRNSKACLQKCKVCFDIFYFLPILKY